MTSGANPSTLHAVVHPDGSAVLKFGAERLDLPAGPFEQTRSAIGENAAHKARQVAAPVHVLISGADGGWEFTVGPDSSVNDVHKLDDAMVAERIATLTPASIPAPPVEIDDEGIDDMTVPRVLPTLSVPPAVPASAAPASLIHDAPQWPAAPATDQPSAPSVPEFVNPTREVPRLPQSAPPPPPATPVVAQPQFPAPGVPTASEAQLQRPSFLRNEPREQPAQSGFRGFLSRVGIQVAPSEAELRERDDERMVSQHWPGPRTVAVVNGKGGASKTPTTILLSAVFAKYGGAGVLAWDNNQTRGTLGWRTERGPHEATLLELLPETERLLGPGAQAADLAHFVHHQAQDKFDVLRSKPMKLAHENRISPEDVSAIHAVAAKYYRLIVIDSGNDESDPMWGQMIDHADQIVLATTTRADHAEAGALLLEALAERDERGAQLARNSVVIVSQADRTASKADVDQVMNGYQALSRVATRIPFDASMVDGHLRHGALQPETQRAWLRAAAEVARGL